MKIILVACGTRGDVQPLAVLGAALKARGHEALLLAPPENAPFAEQARCPFQPFGANLGAAIATTPDPTVRPIAATRWLARFITSETARQIEELPAILRGADLAVGATFVFGLRTAAESIGIRYRFLAYCPQAIPSSHHPSFLLRSHRWPQWVNQLSWRLFFGVEKLLYSGFLNASRKRLGLPPAGWLWTHLLGERPIIASDPELGVLPENGIVRAVQTGYLALEPLTLLGAGDRRGTLPAEIERFLDEGEPPVFVGFGSMKSEDPVATARIVLEAVRALGRRVLLSRGWGAIGAVPEGSDCRFVGSVPHTLLFPRCAAVVHHGGLGTTATAARAGVAQVLCPHMGDQFYWADQLERQGLTPPPVWRARLTAERLCTALERALADRDMAKCRREVAHAIASRDAVGAAVTAIEAGMKT